MPVTLIRTEMNSLPYHEQFDGIEAAPAGVNILCGKKISFPQEELKILMDDPGLAINVNTRSDKIFAETFLRTIKGNLG